jgi:hypothetical protein
MIEPHIFVARDVFETSQNSWQTSSVSVIDGRTGYPQDCKLLKPSINERTKLYEEYN